MKAISIRQPWAWLILHGGKDIENRNRKTDFRGRILIHASKSESRKEFNRVMVWLAENDFRIDLPAFEDLPRGGVVGSAEITGCVNASTSKWFIGRFGYVLANPVAMPFRPYTGQLGIFEVTP